MFPELCVENFWTFAKSFSRVVKTAFQMSGGKLWGLFLTKDFILANSENWANFFLEFSLKFLFSLSKLLHSRRSEKNIVEKVLFFEKLIFFDHFHHFIKIFRTFHQFFSSRLSNVSFQCPDKLCLGNYISSWKNSSLHFFRNLPERRLVFPHFFFSGDVKIAVTVFRTHFRGKIFWKKSFLKFSIRLWGRLFETPRGNFAAGFSKLHLSCPDGTLKHK